MTTLRFAGFELDEVRAELRGRDGAPIRLRPKPFAMLLLFAANAGRVVSKQEAAENEKWKLLAAFYNNLSVAALAAGIIIPLLSIGRGIVSLATWVRFGREFSIEATLTVGLNVFAAVLGLWTAHYLQGRAHRVLKYIQD